MTREFKATILKNALCNASAQNTKSPDNVTYAKGLIVGTASALMFTGLSFAAALALVKEHLPKDFNPEAMPESWR